MVQARDERDEIEATRSGLVCIEALTCDVDVFVGPYAFDCPLSRCGVGIDACDRPRDRRESLCEETVATADIQDVAAELRRDVDQPWVICGVVVPVTAIARQAHTNDCATPRMQLVTRPRQCSRCPSARRRRSMARW